MNTRENTTTNQPSQSNGKVDAYVITFPKDGASEGHTTMEFRHKDGSFVMIPETDKPARISVFPSSREHIFKNNLVNQFFNLIGYRPKSNIVGDLTGVPVPAFSTANLEKDIKVQKNAPDSIRKIEDVPIELAVSTTKEIHDDLQNQNIQFALCYATGFVPTTLRALHSFKLTCEKVKKGGMQHENEAFTNHTGVAIADDLICAGGGYLNHIPDDNHTNIDPLPEFSNCTSVVSKVMEKTASVRPRSNIHSLFPAIYSKELLDNGIGKEVINSPDQLPKDMHESVVKAKEEYPRPSTDIPPDLDLDSHFAVSSLKRSQSIE